MEDTEVVYIGSKPIIKYINAGNWALDRDKSLKLLGRGNNIKTTVDVAEILKRDLKSPKVTIEIDSEKFEDRYVSIISILIIK